MFEPLTIRAFEDSMGFYSTNPRDLMLFLDLGLRTFKNAPAWEELYLGHDTEDEALVYIWVTCTPAQFWRFAIVDFNNNQTINVQSAGGVLLSDIWPEIQQLARGHWIINTVQFGGRS